MSDLSTARKEEPESYSAKDIEVLEGLEPVRRRPGMYIGGTDERALHHLFAEVLEELVLQTLGILGRSRILQGDVDRDAESVGDDKQLREILSGLNLCR